MRRPVYSFAACSTATGNHKLNGFENLPLLIYQFISELEDCLDVIQKLSDVGFSMNFRIV